MGLGSSAAPNFRPLFSTRILPSSAPHRLEGQVLLRKTCRTPTTLNRDREYRLIVAPRLEMGTSPELRRKLGAATELSTHAWNVVGEK